MSCVDCKKCVRYSVVYCTVCKRNARRCSGPACFGRGVRCEACFLSDNQTSKRPIESLETAPLPAAASSSNSDEQKDTLGLQLKKARLAVKLESLEKACQDALDIVRANGNELATKELKTSIIIPWDKIPNMQKLFPEKCTFETGPQKDLNFVFACKFFKAHDLEFALRYNGVKYTGIELGWDNDEVQM